MIKKISNELWYSTITSKCYLSAELAEKAESCVYADVLTSAYSIRNWITQYTDLCKMYKAACNKGDRSLESVFNKYEPKFDAIIQTLYEAGVNNVDSASLIDVWNNDDLDDVECEEDIDCEEIEESVECEEDVDCEDDERYDSDVEYTPEKVVVTVHRVSRSDRRRPNRYNNCNKCNKACDDCN